MRVIEEYQLIEAGFRYQDLGYHTADGGVPAYKLREYLLVRGLVESARRERNGN